MTMVEASQKLSAAFPYRLTHVEAGMWTRRDGSQYMTYRATVFDQTGDVCNGYSSLHSLANAVAQAIECQGKAIGLPVSLSDAALEDVDSLTLKVSNE